MKDAPTITAEDVAARAGVSRWTVARAFKTDASISARAREKVLAAAAELGYAPDLLAASLASDRSQLAALLIDDFDNPHKLVLLDHLSRRLQAEGWGTLLVNTGDPNHAPGALISAGQRRADAAILLGTQFDAEVLGSAQAARKLKKLIVFARYSDNPATVSISCDDAAAMAEIVRHVATRGYRRPIFIAGPDTQSARVDRRDQFRRLWRGGEVESVPVVRYNSAMAFRAVMDRLQHMTAAQRPDVLVCENDILAIGALTAIRHGLGLRVPEDVAVVGFDDIPLAASPAYELTTYRQPVEEMAEALVGLLTSGEPNGDVFCTGQFVPRRTA